MSQNYPASDKLEALLKELEQVGYMPETLQLNPRQAKAIAKADAKATTAAIRTINNPTYKTMPREAKVGILKRIFTRHRYQALRQLKLVHSHNKRKV